MKRMPDFIIAGERRSGTTSIAKWIEGHPDIYLHPKVDIGYFIDSELIGRREWLEGEIDSSLWEKNHSAEDYSKIFEAGKNKIAVGEKSADYFYWEPAHLRMKSIVPDAKIIIILRNPIERAWSHYWNEVGKGREALSFDEAIINEEKRIKNSAYARNHLSYVTRGFYDLSLERFLRVYPKEKILVVIFEESKKDPANTVKEIYRFLGLNPNLGLERVNTRFNNNWTTVPKEFWTKNRILKAIESGFVKLIRKILRVTVKDIYKRRSLLVKIESLTRNTKSDFKISHTTKQNLLEIYLPHIEKLEKLLNKDLSIWKC